MPAAVLLLFLASWLGCSQVDEFDVSNASKVAQTYAALPDGVQRVKKFIVESENADRVFEGFVNDPVNGRVELQKQMDYDGFTGTMEEYILENREKIQQMVTFWRTVLQEMEHQ